jgi:glycosyltransferase involved in cell wall biosynthesis
VLFVGRITDQKGIFHLLEASSKLPAGVQVVLCASAPDTPEIEARLQRALPEHPNVLWIGEMIPVSEVVQLYSHAAVFACPSVYEPFGLINLEAMACQVPVVASAVGGIPEVVVDGETGRLVPVELVEHAGAVEPRDPRGFAQELARALNALLADPELCRTMGVKGRQRAEALFSWAAIARRTLTLYQALVDGHVR